MDKDWTDHIRKYTVFSNPGSTCKKIKQPIKRFKKVYVVQLN